MSIDPIIICDSREQKPLVFTRYKSEIGNLQSGDYSIKGLEHLFAIERKTISDAVGSLTTGRERFERELHRLRGFQFARLLIIGSEAAIHAHKYRSRASPKSILHSLHAFEVRYSVPVVWAGNSENAARLIERWAYWYAREIEKTAQKLVISDPS